MKYLSIICFKLSHYAFKLHIREILFPLSKAYSSKYGAFAGELTWVISVDNIIFLIAFDLVYISNLFTLLDLISECDSVPFLSNFDGVAPAVSAKIYLEIFKRVSNVTKVFPCFVIRQRILVVLRIHWKPLPTCWWSIIIKGWWVPELSRQIIWLTMGRLIVRRTHRVLFHDGFADPTVTIINYFLL